MGRVCLVIPTRNRPHFLARLLKYLSDQRFAHPVLIADASQGKYRAAVEEVVANAGSLQPRLFSAGYEDHWALRVIEALSSTDAEYAVLCGDDDFLIPTALEESVAFLEHHPDYALVHGKTLVIQTRNDQVWSYPYPEPSPHLWGRSIQGRCSGSACSSVEDVAFADGWI